MSSVGRVVETWELNISKRKEAIWNQWGNGIPLVVGSLYAIVVVHAICAPSNIQNCSNIIFHKYSLFTLRVIFWYCLFLHKPACFSVQGRLNKWNTKNAALSSWLHFTFYWAHLEFTIRTKVTGSETRNQKQSALCIVLGIWICLTLNTLKFYGAWNMKKCL